MSKVRGPDISPNERINVLDWNFSTEMSLVTRLSLKKTIRSVLPQIEPHTFSPIHYFVHEKLLWNIFLLENMAN